MLFDIAPRMPHSISPQAGAPVIFVVIIHNELLLVIAKFDHLIVPLAAHVAERWLVLQVIYALKAQ